MLVLLLLATLVYFTSKWAVFDAEELEANRDNRRPLIEEQQIPRGSIATADGVLVAESLPEGGGLARSTCAGIPRAPCSATRSATATWSRADGDRALGERPADRRRERVRDDHRPASRPAAGGRQRRAHARLRGSADRDRGPAVGDRRPRAPGRHWWRSSPPRARCARWPRFRLRPERGPEPRELQGPDRRRVGATAQPPDAEHVSAGVDDEGRHTAAAALDSGEFEPSTVLNADSPKEISGVELQNSGGQSFGDIDMTTALTNSVNTYWAQVGEQLGATTMVTYMERFGFYSDPGSTTRRTRWHRARLQLRQRPRARGLRRRPRGHRTRRRRGPAAGYSDADGGGCGRDRQWQRVDEADLPPGGQGSGQAHDRGARRRRRAGPRDLRGVGGAAQRDDDQRHQEGTASGLSVAGVEFAGKTRTAEIDLEGTNQPWFIVFAPTQDPRICLVAATVERCQGCFGGEVAGQSPPRSPNRSSTR